MHLKHKLVGVSYNHRMLFEAVEMKKLPGIGNHLYWIFLQFSLSSSNFLIVTKLCVPFPVRIDSHAFLSKGLSPFLRYYFCVDLYISWTQRILNEFSESWLLSQKFSLLSKLLCAQCEKLHRRWLLWQGDHPCLHGPVLVSNCKDFLEHQT